MVHFLRCSSAHMPPFFFFFAALLLLLTSSMEVACSDARRLPLLRLLEIDTSKEQEASETSRGGMQQARRALIGSRPPRCERLCISCGHCEAVQVPIVPQVRRHKKTAAADDDEKHVAAAVVTASMFSYRVDGIANYKPLSWKCRCGGTILDP